MNTLSILVADDELETREVLAMFLRSLGHSVTTASGGKDALALVEDRHFDLVITDMLMPDADGAEVIYAVRKSFSDARIIAMTGGGDYLTSELLLRIAETLGAHAHLTKPFSKAQLLEAIGSTGTTADTLVGAA